MAADDETKTGGGSKVTEMDPLKPDKDYFYYMDKANERRRVSKFSIIVEHLELIELEYLKAEALSRQLAGISATTVSHKHTVFALLSHNSKMFVERYVKLTKEKDELEQLKNAEIESLNTQLAGAHEKIGELKNELEVLGNRLSEA